VHSAQIDTGVVLDHPQLRGQFNVAKNFVDNKPFPVERHGTAIAGVIAARSGNGIGSIGVAPGARLIALRACYETHTSSAARCTSFSIAKALQYAIEAKAEVINMSLGGPYARLLAWLIDVAVERGTTVVSAVDVNAFDGGFPASHPRVLAAAGPDTPTYSSNALQAPALNVLTTLPAGRWGFMSGSSIAAAYISGVAAIVADAPAENKRDAIAAVVAPHTHRAPAPRLSLNLDCTSLPRSAGCAAQAR